MPNKHRSRAHSEGDLLIDPGHDDDEAETVLGCSVKSEDANFNRRGSLGSALIKGFASRPDTPTRVLESSFRLSSPNLNRTPKSVRFKFPEQDHYEALAHARKAKEVDVEASEKTNQADLTRAKEVTETIQETVARLLDKDLQLRLESDQEKENPRRKVYYFNYQSVDDEPKEWWSGRACLILKIAIIILWTLLAFAVVLIIIL